MTPEQITAEQIAHEGLILRGVVGSSAHGLALDDQDDRDLMGVAIEPRTHVIGLRHFETYTWRTQPQGVRSGPGDIDLTVYSLRKFARLAAKGNPTVLTLLYLPHYDVETLAGTMLRTNRDLFYSKHAGRAFLGYMRQQRERLAGERGQKRTNRPELIAAHGFDTKYAGHVLRLGYQGVEYMRDGKLTLPMNGGARDTVLDARRGKLSLSEVLDLGRHLETLLEAQLDHNSTPDEPRYDRINSMLIDLYTYQWEATDAQHRVPQNGQPVRP